MWLPESCPKTKPGVPAGCPTLYGTHAHALTLPSPHLAARRVCRARCPPWADHRRPLTLTGLRPGRGLRPGTSQSPDLQAQGKGLGALK